MHIHISISIRPPTPTLTPMTISRLSEREGRVKTHKIHPKSILTSVSGYYSRRRNSIRSRTRSTCYSTRFFRYQGHPEGHQNIQRHHKLPKHNYINHITELTYILTINNSEETQKNEKIQQHGTLLVQCHDSVNFFRSKPHPVILPTLSRDSLTNHITCWLTNHVT